MSAARHAIASRILGNVAISRGYDVKVSEVHGCSAARALTYVKFADKVLYLGNLRRGGYNSGV